MGTEKRCQYMTSFFRNAINKNWDRVQCETAKEFELLEHNAIMDTFRQLYREEIGVVLKWKS